MKRCMQAEEDDITHQHNRFVKLPDAFLHQMSNAATDLLVFRDLEEFIIN